MGTTPLPYHSLGTLLNHVRIVQEDPETNTIIEELKHVRVDRELSRREFLRICRWKSPRSTRQCRRNSAHVIKEASREVFRSRDEKRRIELLTNLHGVSVPTASAILTLTNPDRYGVIDIRVWQLLHALGTVKDKPGGQGFGFDHWFRYLRLLRHHARRLGVSVRRIELTLFRFHQRYQAGTLYPMRMGK